MVEIFGIKAPFLVSTILFAISSIFLFFVSNIEEKYQKQTKVLNSFRVVFKEKRLIAVVSLFMLLVFIDSIYDPFLSVFLLEEAGFNFGKIGLLISVLFILNFLTSPIIGRLGDTFGTRLNLSTTLIGYGAGLLVVSMSRSFAQIFIGVVIIGLTRHIYTLSTIAASRNLGRIPPQMAYGILYFLRTSLSTVGPLIGGALAEKSLSLPITYAGILYMAASALVMVTLEVKTRKSHKLALQR